MLHQMKTLDPQRIERFSFCCFSLFPAFVHKTCSKRCFQRFVFCFAVSV